MGSISLLLRSDNKYVLGSIWKNLDINFDPEKEEVDHVIFWSEGMYTQQNDTIVCIDVKDHRMVRLVELDALFFEL